MTTLRFLPRLGIPRRLRIKVGVVCRFPSVLAANPFGSPSCSVWIFCWRVSSLPPLSASSRRRLAFSRVVDVLETPVPMRLTVSVERLKNSRHGFLLYTVPTNLFCGAGRNSFRFLDRWREAYGGDAPLVLFCAPRRTRGAHSICARTRSAIQVERPASRIGGGSSKRATMRRTVRCVTLSAAASAHSSTSALAGSSASARIDFGRGRDRRRGFQIAP